VRISLTLKFGLLTALLVLIVAGTTTYVLVYRLGDERRRELVAHDRELARMLAGLRTADGSVDFDTLTRFVSSSDKVALGLVYAMELDEAGRLQRGALNPRLFAQLHPSYRERVLQGRAHVLRALAAGKIERAGRIKEYANPVPAGQLRLGFDFYRIDREISQQSQIGFVILAAGLLFGVVAAGLLAHRTTRPIRQLARAMKAVAEGDLTQTVQVGAHDELASLAGSFNQMMRNVREMRGVKELAAGYLSSHVVDRALAAGGVAQLPIEERAATVMRLRLAGWRGAGRNVSPRGGLTRLNQYLGPVIDVLIRHGGTVVALDSSGLQVIWGAPVEDPQAELRCLEAALAVTALLANEVRQSALAGLKPVQSAIGISTGRVALGELGSTERHSFSVVGEPVEFSRAIEALARPGEILFSEATFTKVADYVESQVSPPLMLDGLDEAIPLYRLAGLKGE
jgi:class 3 adenylate cyclase